MKSIAISNRFDNKSDRRGRFGITRGQAILFFLTFSLFFYLLTELVFASGLQAPLPGKEVTVREGDSLWKLATRYQADAKMEVKELVQAIKEANDLKDAIIYPGQTLVIPLAVQPASE